MKNYAQHVKEKLMGSIKSLKDTYVQHAIIDLQNREDTTLPALRQQLKDCEQGIENMLNAIQMGILTASTKTRLEELEAHQNELKLSIMQAELQKPKYTKEQIVIWINRFKFGDVDDTEYQKQIIDTFINAIYVFDDKLVFTYNFKDGTEAIPLKAVEEAFGSDLTQVAPSDQVKTMSLDLFLISSEIAQRCPFGRQRGLCLFFSEKEHAKIAHVHRAWMLCGLRRKCGRTLPAFYLKYCGVNNKMNKRRRIGIIPIVPALKNNDRAIVHIHRI